MMKFNKVMLNQSKTVVLHRFVASTLTVSNVSQFGGVNVTRRAFDAKTSRSKSSKWGGSSVGSAHVAKAVSEARAVLERNYDLSQGKVIELKSEFESASAENKVLKERVRELNDRIDIFTTKSASATLGADETDNLKATLLEQAVSIKKMERQVAETLDLKRRLELQDSKVKDLGVALSKIDAALSLRGTEADCHEFLFQTLADIVKEFVVALKVAVSKAVPNSVGQTNRAWKESLDTRLGNMELNQAVLEIYKAGMEIIGQLNGDSEVLTDPEVLQTLYAAVAWEKDGAISALAQRMTIANADIEDESVDGSPGVMSPTVGSSKGRNGPVTPGSVDSRADQLRSPGYLLSPPRPSVSDEVIGDATSLMRFVTEMIVGREATHARADERVFPGFPSDPFEVPDAAKGNGRFEAFVTQINEFKSQVSALLSAHPIAGEPVGSIAELFDGIATHVSGLESTNARLQTELDKRGGGAVEGMRMLREEVAALRKGQGDLETKAASATREAAASSRGLSTTRRDLDDMTANFNSVERELRDQKVANHALQLDALSQTALIQRLQEQQTITIVEQIQIRSVFFERLPIPGNAPQAAVSMSNHLSSVDLIHNRRLFEFPRTWQPVSRDSIVTMLSSLGSQSGFFDRTDVIELSPREFVMSAFYGADIPSRGSSHVRPATIRTALSTIAASGNRDFTSQELIVMLTDTPAGGKANGRK